MVKILLKYYQNMDRVVFSIFLWLIPTLSLNKLKLCIGFFCMAYPNMLRPQSRPFTI
jgi:hypothetical protein